MPDPGGDSYFPSTTGGQDSSGQIGLNPATGKYEYFTYVNGKAVFSGVQAPMTQQTVPETYEQKLALATAPRSSNNTSSSTSYSTSQSFQDPRALDIQQQQVTAQITAAQQSHDIAVRSQNFAEAKYWQDRLDTLSARAQDMSFQRAQQTQQQQYASGENALNRGATSSENALSRVFSGEQAVQQRAYSSGESAIDRAQRAGEFAASYGLQKAAAERQQRADQLGAAETYSRLSGSADLTGYQRFLDAGGGNAGNAIMRGASSITPEGQLGAARALETAKTPPQAIPGYSYQPQQNPFANMQPPQPAQAQAPAGPTQTTWMPGSEQYAGMSPQQAASVEQVRAAAFQPGGAFGFTAGETPPRYALGTRPALGNVGTTPPMQTVIAGDSTAADPAAGGAHPEAITPVDPPGPDNASVTIDPLTQPGVGGTDEGSIGALLIAVGKFLDAQQAPAPIGDPTLLGQTGRYALGTPVIGDPLLGQPAAGAPAGDSSMTPQDDPWVSQVLATRRNTPYNVNPFAANFFQQTPTKRAIDAAAFQTATGVPGSELDFLAQQYSPGALGRNAGLGL